jgi:hypothetical protein
VGVACKKTPPATEIILEIGTNIPVPSGMDAITLTISTPTSPGFFNTTYPLGPGAGQIMLPKRMTLTPSDSGTSITVRVDGSLGATTNVIVSRSATTSFVQDQSLLLRIDLLADCVGTTCASGQTCVTAGHCGSASIDPSTLPRFDPTQSPLGIDASAPSDGATDRVAADGLTEAGGDGRTDPGDAARDRGTDGLLLIDGLVSSDALSDVPASSDVALASDGPVPSDVPIPSVDALEPSDGPVSTDGPGPDVPAASKPNGATCVSKAECQSGVCVDGYCCNSDCSGNCMSCKVPGSLGICSLVPLNDPSDGECADEGAQTCGRNGKCNGAGGCMLYPSGVACSPETCPAGSSMHTRPGLCDGHGVCSAGQVLDCAPFLCNPPSKACYTGCSTGGAECKPPGLCTNGSCGKKSNGQTCTSPSECTSNSCEQGVCCGGPCQGMCMSCSVDGSIGTCSAVKPGKNDPLNRCKDQGVASCGNNGLCDGSGACQNYAAGLPCQAGTCDPSKAIFSVPTCNGSGLCGPSPASACAPYTCDAKGCKKSCASLSDCAPGNVCSPSGTCVSSTAEDCMNGIDDDGNGLIDCADPACNAGFMCVPQVPSGFAGPGEVYEGVGPSPPCDPHYTKDYPAATSTTPKCDFSCGTCTCGDPTGVTCSNPSVTSGTALGRCDGKLTPIPAGCNAIDATATVFGTKPGAASGGSCAATPGTLKLSPITSNTAHLCAAGAKGGLGCNDPGYVCWPKPQTPFLPQACVFANSDLSCPSTGYTVKRSYYDSASVVKDTRACTSTCDCATPSGSTCSATVGFWAASTCALRTTEYSVPSACQAIPAGAAYMKASTAIVTGGSCTPTGTMTPTGGCTPLGNPTTACCTP